MENFEVIYRFLITRKPCAYHPFFVAYKACRYEPILRIKGPHAHREIVGRAQQKPGIAGPLNPLHGIVVPCVHMLTYEWCEL